MKKEVLRHPLKDKFLIFGLDSQDTDRKIRVFDFRKQSSYTDAKVNIETTIDELKPGITEKLSLNVEINDVEKL